MSQAEYASLRGVSRQAIYKLVKRGVIPLIEGKIDPQVADMKISSQLNPARSKTLASDAMQSAPVVSRTSAPLPATEHTDASKVVDINTYAGAKALREKFEALRAQSEFHKSIGALVDADGVRRAALAAGKATRDAVMPVAVRTATQLAVMTDPREITALLERELRRALQDAAKSLLPAQADVASGAATPAA